jgi:hypothetical protein
VNSSETLDVAAKSVGFAVIVFGALWAAARWIFGVGAAKKELDTDRLAIQASIANGFASVKQEFAASIAEVKSSVASIGVTLGTRIDGVSSRMDRVERHREDDVKTRAVADAIEQQRKIDEAARRATAEERERTLQAAVAVIRDDLDELVKTSGAERQAARDQLHDHHSRIATLERELRTPESAE